MQEGRMRRGSSLKMGKIYRLTFPGIAARVIEPPANVQVGKYPYLVESLILRSRWWVNERGEPDNIHTPHLIPASDESAQETSAAAVIQGQISSGK
jgi:hypothetical protein